MTTNEMRTNSPQSGTGNIADRSTSSLKTRLADNTFVMYSTDNGPHMNAWARIAR